MPPPPAAGAGGSYRLDPEALKARLAEGNGLIRQLADAAQTARAMTYVEAPAQESASNDVADQIVKSGHAYIHANESMRDFLVAECEKLNKALEQYNAAEQQAAENLKRRHA